MLVTVSCQMVEELSNVYIISRLCSSGARSPQRTNIWSRATEKEKRSPVRAHRFRLV